MRHLYWFQNDLRLEDNPGLLAHAGAESLLLVYIWPRPRPWCHLHSLGEQRTRFLTESLHALAARLRDLGQDLLVLEGSPELVLPDLVRQYGIQRIGTSRAPGSYESATLRHLRQRLEVPVDVHLGNTLFDESSLPFAPGELPDQFSPFRRRVENTEFIQPVASPAELPPPPSVRFHAIPPANCRPNPALPIRGGAVAGQRRVNQFIGEQQNILRYKQTRNCLDPLDGSSTFSPWLATGCLSVREVAQKIREFEQAVEANESTYWLYFELLWREFFHWRALQDGSALFRPGGRRRRVHHCTFEPRSFARWCQGDTDFPLVNALMHQLVATGWMSNRGRQIAASCLIHEYGVDWRYGAAFFEKHLIDYDVGSNYGNWQYIAGVGADPRGGRHFNQAKQAAEHDPDGTFIHKWDGDRPAQPRYVTDAADWPIHPDDD